MDRMARYQRWQDYRVGQLSAVINLFLGFAVASLAYALALKLSEKPPARVPLDWIIYWWSASAVSGALATITKLLDYRYTARKILNRTTLNERITKACGSLTWALFWTEAATYTVGAVLFVRGVLEG